MCIRDRSCLAAFAAWLLLHRKHRGRPALGWVQAAPVKAAAAEAEKDAAAPAGESDGGAAQHAAPEAAEAQGESDTPPTENGQAQQEQEEPHGEN